MSLVTWNGHLLLTNGKLTLGPAAAECCCPEEPVGGCCGRSTPGAGSSEGAAYYPLTLHVRITRGSCTLPSTPVEFDLTWDSTILEWRNASVSLGDGAYSVTTMTLICSTPNWGASLTGGICGCGGIGGSCAFDMVPTLTGGECNPVDLDGTAIMTGLNCCGNMMGGSVTIEVWE